MYLRLYKKNSLAYRCKREKARIVTCEIIGRGLTISDFSHKDKLKEICSITLCQASIASFDTAEKNRFSFLCYCDQLVLHILKEVDMHVYKVSNRKV